MRLRLIILFGLLILFGINIHARIIEESQLDTCLVEVLYERIKATDTLDIENKYRKDNLTLRAGNNAAAFYSAHRKNFDSISSRNPEIIIALFKDQDRFKQFSIEEKEVIFRIKKDNRIILHDRFDLTHWLYEETIETPKWEITDSISVINGLNCIKALTNFRGRRWIAWFTPDIPIPEGPWKLCGLPGLIIYTYDLKGHYSYTAKEITTKPTGYVDFFNYYDRCKTDRMAALKLKRKSLQESIVEKMRSSGVFGNIPASAKKTEILNERNYDFEETDYPHD